MWDGLKRKKICVRQHDEYDCGAASLCAIAAWYGLFLPLYSVREACGCTKDGVTIDGILKGAKTFGLEGEALKSPNRNIEELTKLKDPFIVLLHKEDGMLHFAVVLRVLFHKAEIMDPAMGETINYPINRFAGEWSGYIILLEPGKDFHKGNLRIPFHKRVSSLVSNHKRELALSMFLSLAIVLAGTANSFILQRVIDEIIPNRKKEELLVLAVVLPLLIALMAIMEQIRGTSILKKGIKIDKELVFKYIHKVFSLPSHIFNRFTPGDFNSRIGDVYKIRVFISEWLVAVPLCCATLLIVFTLMIFTNCKLAILSILFFPLYAVICIVSVILNRRYGKNLALLSARFESSMLHGMDALITIKHFGAEGIALKKIKERYNLFQQELLKAGKCSVLIGTAGESIGYILLAATIIAGGFMVTGGELTTGEIVSFYTLCSLFSAPLDGLVRMADLFSHASVSVERLYEIMDITDEEAPGKHKTIPECSKTIGNGIVVDKISFSYPGRNKIFEEFSTIIKAHKITAICGGNGCGKSTLVALLMRDIAPDKGTITAGGRDISDLPLEKWRKHISIIPQKAFIFNDTLLANITCNQEEADMKRVSDVCVEAGLTEVIKRLPNGIFTNIGGAAGLSGGEMQKISIARTLFRDPQIYIFDEATSNMDELSEKSTIGLVKKLGKMGKTVIVISHSSGMRSIADEFIDLS